MLSEVRTFQEAVRIFSTCFEPQYDTWAPNYERDLLTMEYRAHEHAVTVLMQHFTGDPSQTRVLDVACGSGLVAKRMVELGFCQFVGVDASEGMLKEAKLTGLYQAVHHAVLGKQPLSVEKESFDVVTVAGAMNPGFIPVSAVREFYEATRPGGLVCMSRGNYPVQSTSLTTRRWRKRWPRWRPRVCGLDSQPPRSKDIWPTTFM
uniref:Methyltransferase domain-containing protein n=1 Tax=Neogobius melanostomus TaxID=47308 RepID=A0A8C6TSL4_9GOBI